MMGLLSIGEQFPTYSKTAVVSIEHGKEFATITNEDHIDAGKWQVIFFWPKDFTFVCPTEIVSFNNAYDEFAKRNAELVGGSTDSEYVHLAWRMNDKTLRDLKFPMLADTNKSLSADLGILTKEERVCYRATFIIDPQGIIRFVSVNDLSVGRNVQEVIRVLDALQTDKLVPCNWTPGEATLN
ncbi:MAG: peroxiredoxin [Chitinophagales bacterium]|nr:peroxiredoxin [Chitinophagales bacterium]